MLSRVNKPWCTSLIDFQFFFKYLIDLFNFDPWPFWHFGQFKLLESWKKLLMLCKVQQNHHIFWINLITLEYYIWQRGCPGVAGRRHLVRLGTVGPGLMLSQTCVLDHPWDPKYVAKWSLFRGSLSYKNRKWDPKG